MNILVTILGRGGSKGVKSKNIRILNGHPLIAYTISAADLFQGDFHKDIVVSSDSPEILQVASEYGVSHLVKRDEKTSHDQAPKWAGIKFTLEEMEEKQGKKYDYIIDLDITSPIRSTADIKRAFHLAVKEDCNIVFSVTGAHRNPYFNMVELDGNGYAKLVKEGNYTARQQAPVVYDMNASIYVYKRAVMDSFTTVFNRAKVIVMERTTDIDDEFDLLFVEFLIQNLVSSGSSYKEVVDHISQLKK